MRQFEYQCPECRVVLATTSPDGDWKCRCSGEEKPMKRLYSLSGVILKGSGFYKTDTRGKDS